MRVGVVVSALGMVSGSGVVGVVARVAREVRVISRVPSIAAPPTFFVAFGSAAEF